MTLLLQDFLELLSRMENGQTDWASLWNFSDPTWKSKSTWEHIWIHCRPTFADHNYKCQNNCVKLCGTKVETLCKQPYSVLLWQPGNSLNNANTSVCCNSCWNIVYSDIPVVGKSDRGPRLYGDKSCEICCPLFDSYNRTIRTSFDWVKSKVTSQPEELRPHKPSQVLLSLHSVSSLYCLETKLITLINDCVFFSCSTHFLMRTLKWNCGLFWDFY